MSATRTIDLTIVPSGHPFGCRGCAERIVDRVRSLAGVTRVTIDEEPRQITCDYEPALITPDAIDHAVRQAIVENDAHWHYRSVAIEGMDCADCARAIERGLARIDGVALVDVSFGAARMAIEYDARRVSAATIDRAVRDLGYAISEPAAHAVSERAAIARLLRRRENLATLASGMLLLFGIVALLAGAPRVATALFAASVAVGGVPLGLKGIRVAWLSRRLDINVLMTIAVVGAVALGDWIEASTVVFLFSLGEALEGYAMDRVRRSVRALLSLSPAVATVVRDGKDVSAPVGSVMPGEVVAIRPGERVPLDALVLSGVSRVDQAALTGESVPVLKEAGDQIFAGTMNTDGPLIARVLRPAADSSVARIIRLVEQAQASRAPTQRIIDRFAAYYTPAVIAAAMLLALVPLVFEGEWREWIGRALVLLVISCPCALVISTPVAIVSALSAAARRGILIKGGAALERAATIDTVALDKTGTLTLGRPAVVDVVALDGRTEEEVLADAAALERRSEHPLGKAIVEAARERSLAFGDAERVRSVPGLGIVGRMDGREVRVGSRRLFHNDALVPEVEGALAAIEAAGGTAVLVGDDTRVTGVIRLADETRPDARGAVAHLHRAGVRRVVMLTGDRAAAAATVARATGVDDVRAELLPEDKVAAIDALRREGARVAMVGDGVNDAPSLAAADVGIAMGVAGTDAAIETADIALMGDDLHGVAETIALGRRTRRTIVANVAFALGVKALTLALAIGGVATLWMAIAADVGASLLVIGNGLLLLRRRS